jgi:hypothetical protein
MELMSAQPLAAYKLDVYFPDDQKKSFDVNGPGEDGYLTISSHKENDV